MSERTMSKSSITITFLLLALVATNSWWVYQAIDVGVKATYQDVARRQTEGALDQVLAVVPVACSRDKETIIQAAMPEHYKSEPFSKDGYIWVSNIGLAFGQAGNLVQVTKAWQ